MLDFSASRLARESAERLMARIERYFLFAAAVCALTLIFRIHLGG